MCAIESWTGWLKHRMPWPLAWVIAVLTVPMFAVGEPREPLSLPQDARAALKAAARDPFVLPALAPLPVAVIAPSPPVPAAPVVPIEPAPQLSFIGRMQAPDGKAIVLARWGDGSSVRLEQGKVLANGYRVERMGADMVELMHPQTQAVVQLALPPAPRFETR